MASAYIIRDENGNEYRGQTLRGALAQMPDSVQENLPKQASVGETGKTPQSIEDIWSDSERNAPVNIERVYY